MNDKTDYEKMLLDPASAFENPEQVLDHGGLSREQKIEILRRWEYDASEVAVAEEEGMAGTEPLMVQQVLQALHKITGGVDVEHTGPTKQGGV